MATAEEEKSSSPSGCGISSFYSGFFHRWNCTSRRASSSSSSSAGQQVSPVVAISAPTKRRSPIENNNNALVVVARRGGGISMPAPSQRQSQRVQMQMVPAKVGNNANAQPRTGTTPTGNHRKAVWEAASVRTLSISPELDSMIYDHQKAKGGSSNRVRASSSNVMLAGDLRNLQTSTTTSTSTSTSSSTTSSTTKSKEETKYYYNNYNYQAADDELRERRRRTSNIVINNNNIGKDVEVAPPVLVVPAASMCRAVSKRVDPEELKEMGNEEYGNGRYAEAVSFYDRAIALEPRRAAYRNSKAAALAALGSLLEAVAECREALRIDPAYNRIHHRLASLYLRLGEAYKALQHYRRLGNEANPADMSKAQTLQAHLSTSKEARMKKDWQTVLQEAEAAISSGAASAPQVFAAQAEALMKLHRHDDAYLALIDAPIYDTDKSTKFFGTAGSAYILSVRAQISVAAGKFDEAVSMAHKANQIDPSNKDIATTARRMRAMASARSKGNDLFKTGRFSEACIAYGEGLDQDSHNSILLCNRATCRSKLKQYEKAIDDCNAALSVRPSYSKARLRRADCYIKLEKWEEALRDYEVLLEEMAGDEEVQKAFTRAQTQLRKQKSKEDNAEATMMKLTTARDIIVIRAPEKHVDIIHCKGTSVILFCDKSHETEQMMPFMGQLCRKYTSVNFLKVEKEDLMKSEGVNSQPAIRIYKNGSILKHMNGCDWDMLERSIKKLNT